MTTDPNFTSEPGCGFTSLTGAPPALLGPDEQSVEHSSKIVRVRQPNSVERFVGSLGKLFTDSAKATALIIGAVGTIAIGVVSAFLSNDKVAAAVGRALAELVKSDKPHPPPPPPVVTPPPAPTSLAHESPPATEFGHVLTSSSSRLQSEAARSVDVSEPLPESLIPLQASPEGAPVPEEAPAEPVIPRQANPENEAAPELPQDPASEPELNETPAEEDAPAAPKGDVVARR